MAMHASMLVLYLDRVPDVVHLGTVCTQLLLKLHHSRSDDCKRHARARFRHTLVTDSTPEIGPSMRHSHLELLVWCAFPTLRSPPP